MNRFLGACCVLLVIVGLCIAQAQEKPKAAAPGKTPAAAPGTKAPAKAPAAAPETKASTAKTSAAKAPEVKPAAPAPRKLTPEEEASVQAAERLVKAFHDRDAKAFAGAFTADGEYIDEHGQIFHGRKAIEQDFAAFFEVHPEPKIELEIATVRAIAAGLIAVDGDTHFTRHKGEDPVLGHCSFICTKEGNKWLIASLREIESVGETPSHHDHVAQLEWLVGDWIDEGEDSHVHFSCHWDDSGNYLIRDFEVHFAGEPTMTGTQRIGYDPVTGHLKSWVFDSDGGHSEGFFHHDGESWHLHATGVTAEGHMASGTNVFTSLDDHRMTWAALDRVASGDRIPDIEPVTIVRKPPTPAQRK
ncbi:MAG: SgcJ/EcaC family oxidoreductase [Planctomycetia bacterium]|nr:SgcJ/EcaC family oxidoreductase [Planctomycetia bacterium]